MPSSYRSSGKSLSAFSVKWSSFKRTRYLDLGVCGGDALAIFRSPRARINTYIAPNTPQIYLDLLDLVDL